ncbi:putative ABC transporter ATP-binding protein [Nonomuraea coxensis DSM 45129]|uniref:ABC transporter ATP-binding protein n=1 Tax=Nonomuraea coxensis DSM 45129 TaxID=1122611 RepID=A0ABX8UBH4_9ACTN|nr:ABC-F family ATP-binding cassette domain-containing protein [Nonomuraea coxensis]QYC44083.1 putative ABC transporter ATP-binding protein [Nonomuraea coxensis DSM 45129]
MLDDVTVSVKAGERAGVVGENGSGKSTLLRLLAGVERPDDGEITVRPGRAAGPDDHDDHDDHDDLGYLGQTLGLPDTHTVQQAVDTALAGLRAIERRLRALETALATPPGDDTATAAALAEYGDLQTLYEARGGYEADARVDKAFHGLGLAHVGRDRTLGSLSGGERARLGLACVLAAAPRVLLLDEPTNHLDEPALAWLEDRLREHRGTVVVTSHDRVFLGRVATAVLEVEGGAVTRFGGGYDGFLAAKAAARARWEQAYAAWCAEVRHVREHAATTAHRVAAGGPMRDNNKMAYDRNAGRVQSSVSSRVRNAHERLRRLLDDPVPRPPSPLHFRSPFAPSPAPVSPVPVSGDRTAPTGTAATPETPGTDPLPLAVPAQRPLDQDGPAAARRAGPPVVELRDVRVGEGRLHITHLALAQGDRLLVRGPNGAGKSTLLQALAEQAARASVRVGHLPQEVTFAPGLTVLAAYGHGHPDEREAALLATGLFAPHTLRQKVGELSVGQRRRLALARLLASEHDLLLLDEPTNHLSPLLAEELEQALDHYRGTLVVVSHDRALTRRFRGEHLHLVGGRVC